MFQNFVTFYCNWKLIFWNHFYYDKRIQSYMQRFKNWLQYLTTAILIAQIFWKNSRKAIRRKTIIIAIYVKLYTIYFLLIFLESSGLFL